MSQALATSQPKPFPAQLDEYQDQLKAALPSHISVERFKRTVLTACNQTPGLLAVDRRSLFNAAVKCATDGLLPDGREAALVEFGGKAQYMPMVRGLIKLARQSGEIATLSAYVVREKDEFEYVLGDDERLHHKPMIEGDAGKARLVYATVTFKDGTKQREVMTLAEIERVRAVSRAKNSGPWTQWWDEMARKTVIRRLLKYVTLSPEVARAVDRDEEGEFEGMKRAALAAVPTPQQEALSAMAVEVEDAADPLPPADEEISQDTPFDWSRYVEMTVADFAKHKTRAALTKDWDDIKERLMNEDAPEDVRASLTEAYLNRTRELPAK